MRIHRAGARALALALSLSLAPLAILADLGSPSSPSPRPVAAVVTSEAAFEAIPVAPRRLAVRASRAARPQAPVFVAPDGSRITVERIRRFLEAQASPMAPYAGEIVRAGIRWRVDPRAVVAIAGVESTFGIYRFGYNAWGWASPRVRYHSWPSAIALYTAALSGGYPGMRFGDFAAGAARYAPVDPPTWAAKCAAVFRSI